MTNKLFLFGACAGAAITGFCANKTAELVESANDGAGISSLTNAVKWTDADNWTPGITSGSDYWTGAQQPAPDTDYTIQAGTVRMPRENFEKYEFVGKSLTVGTPSVGATLALGWNSHNVHYKFNKLILQRGGFSNYYNSPLNIHGEVEIKNTLFESGGQASMYLHQNGFIWKSANAEPYSYCFHDKVTAAPGTALSIRITTYNASDPYNNCMQTNMITRFNDLSAFAGKLQILPWGNKKRDEYVGLETPTNGSDAAKNAIPACVRRSTLQLTKDTVGPMPGTIETWRGSAIQFFDAETDFTVAKLDLAGDDVLSLYLDLDNKKCGKMTVTDSYTHQHYAGAGKTLIRIKSMGTCLDEIKFPILKLAEGAQGELDVNDFDFEDMGACFFSTTTYELTVEDNTLYLSHKKIVTLTKADAANAAESLRKGTTKTITNLWSDLEWPSSDKDYIVAGMAIRGPSAATDPKAGETSSDYKFEGHSLTLENGAQLVQRAGTRTHIEDLRIISQNGSNTITHYVPSQKVWPFTLWESNTGAYNGLATLSGHAKFYCKPDFVRNVTFSLSNGRGVKYEMDFEGSGIWSVKSYGEDTTRAPRVVHWFSSINTNALTTRVLLSGDAYTWKAASNKTGNDIQCPTMDYHNFVLIDDPRCLGGTLPTFSQNALEIRDYSMLWPTKTMTFSDKTRGIQFGTPSAGVSQVSQLMITNNLTLGIAVPVNYAHKNSEVYVRGGGTLRLDNGCGPKFSYNTGATAKPSADSQNNLRICDGTLNVTSYEVVDGLTLVFSNNTTLAVSSNGRGPMFAKYGMLNEKCAGAPVVLEGTDKLKVNLTNLGAKPPKSMVIMTVKSEYADDLMSKIDVSNSYDGYDLELKAVDVAAPSSGATLKAITAKFSCGLVFILK